MSHQEAGRQIDTSSNITPLWGPQAAELSPDHELVLLGAAEPGTITPATHDMYKMYMMAEECFSGESGRGMRPKVLLVDRETKVESYRIAADYLLGEGVNPEELDMLFTEFGHWRYRDIEHGSIYDYNSKQVNLTIKRILKPINNIVDRALDGISPDGYNKHGEEHSDRTTRQVIILNDYLGQPDVVRRDSIIASRAHDIGCMFTRVGHSFGSLGMLKAIIPSIQEDPESFQAISRAILFHDTDSLQGLTAQWKGVSSDERLQRLADFMGPVGLTLLMADKVEIGKGRVSDKIWAGRIINDPHAVVNLLGKHERIEPENETFRWQLQYNPDFTPEQMEQYKHFAHGWQRRRRSGEVNITFEDWRKMFWGIYTDRTITFAEAAMAYFPFVQNVEIQMFDARTGNLQSTEVLRRETLDRDEARLLGQQKALISEGVLKYR